MRITSIEQTCGACPSQWEGTLDDGRMIYIRYRWGHLTARVSGKPTTNVFDAVHSACIVNEMVGDALDGVIMWDEVIPYLEQAGVSVE